jgi:hypothetical protein
MVLMYFILIGGNYESRRNMRKYVENYMADENLKTIWQMKIQSLPTKCLIKH